MRICAPTVKPEFTQIDCEMSFVEQEDILDMFEGMIKSIFLDVKGIDIKEKVERMTLGRCNVELW